MKEWWRKLGNTNELRGYGSAGAWAPAKSPNGCLAPVLRKNYVISDSISWKISMVISSENKIKPLLFFIIISQNWWKKDQKFWTGQPSSESPGVWTLKSHSWNYIPEAVELIGSSNHVVTILSVTFCSYWPSFKKLRICVVQLTILKMKLGRCGCRSKISCIWAFLTSWSNAWRILTKPEPTKKKE